MIHLINQLKFEIGCPGEEQAFQLRHSFQDSVQEQIIMAVDKCCSDQVPEDQWIQIDRIEIDAGVFSSHSFYTDLGIVFKQKFEEQLSKQLSILSSEKKERSRQYSQTELLIFFLEGGTLPWWAAEEEVDINSIATEVLNTEPAVLTKFLISKQSDIAVWQRIAFQLNQPSVSGIISFFETLSAFKTLFSNWVMKIDNILPAMPEASTENREMKINGILIRHAREILAGVKNREDARRLFITHIEDLMAVSDKRMLSVMSAIVIEEGEQVVFKIPDEHMGDLATDSSYKPEKSTTVQQEIKKFPVKDAGLILLAPFFQSIFSKLGFSSKEGWTSYEAACRAVHLLKFISTGKQQLPEYSLVLEKLICGLMPDEPIPLKIELTNEEVDEAVLLLQSVLEHWKVLGNTSIAGLRETFFRRDGLVTAKDKDWVLQVERKTLDLLLDSIPWGYNAVKLPWNGYIIYTEW